MPFLNYGLQSADWSESIFRQMRERTVDGIMGDNWHRFFTENFEAHG